MLIIFPLLLDTCSRCTEHSGYTKRQKPSTHNELQPATNLYSKIKDPGYGMVDDSILVVVGPVLMLYINIYVLGRSGESAARGRLCGQRAMPPGGT